jgi:hypothetical protein
MELKDLVKIDFTPGPKGNGKATLFVKATIDQEALEPVKQVCSLIAAAGAVDARLGYNPENIASTVLAAIHQDDDAHDTCTLTACLNPLHPGPCKGWKGTLHSVSPAAWHALEAARVEKANHTRIKKIEALKAQGKPIPHKLLQPIVAKQHPNAGKTANAATGEAHAAGKAVSDAAGVHVKEPGKISLGQAVKAIPQNSGEKGPKGKKPTVMSKGIAFVIAQEKVTPQYKLDKAAAITPEQWNGLSHDDKAVIRGELLKIKKDGFGPQQKKADDLLTKLAEKPDTITAPSGKVYQKVTLKDLENPPTTHPSPTKVTSQAQAEAAVAINDAIPGVKKASGTAMFQDAFDKMKAKGTVEDHQAFKAMVNAYAQAALKQAHADQMPGLGHGANGVGIGEFHKEIADHIKEGKPGLPPLVAKMVAHHEKAKSGNVKEGIEKAAAKAAAPEPPKTESLGEKVKTTAAKPKHTYTVVHNGETITRTSTADYTHASLVQKGHDGPVVVWGFHKSEANALATPLTSSQKQNGFKVVGALPVTKHENGKKVEPAKLSDIATPATAVHTSAKIPASEKPKDLPKHVQEAIAMAKGEAPGATWSKNHLAAYQKLSAEEYAALPPDIQSKIVAELAKGTTKFLDPKKIAATKELLQKFKGGLAKAHTTEAEKLTPEAAVTHVTPKGLVTEIQKHGLVKISHGGVEHVIGFEDSDKHAQLSQVTGIGSGTGHYVIKPPGGASIHLGKNEQVALHGPADKAAPPAKIGISTHLHDHSVTQAQAKELAANTGVFSTYLVAKKAADLTENPDSAELAQNAAVTAKTLAEISTKGAPASVLKQPEVFAAIQHFEQVATANLHAYAVKNAKEKAFNKVNAKLADPDISPVEKAFLIKYRQHLLTHPVDTSPEHLTQLQDAATLAKKQLDDAVHAGLKKANAPAVADMSNAQIADRAKELLGEAGVNPKVNLSLTEVKDANVKGKAYAAALLKEYPGLEASSPAISAKYQGLVNSSTQHYATLENKKKLFEHFEKHHLAIADSGHSITGAKLTPQDQKVIVKHIQLVKQSHGYLDTTLTQTTEKLDKAEAQFHAAAKTATETPAEPIKLSDYDVATIGESYSKAWSDHASKAVLYGVKTYAQKQDMKAHPEYAPLTQNLGDLKALSGMLATAHAQEHTAKLNVPTDPETGFELAGPEKKAWLNAVMHRQVLESKAASVHKEAQARLDKIRTDVGLKKRSLPKLDAPAVKAAAAESGYYKTSGYSGPNYGKAHTAKHYMVAKVGPKHAVVHQTASEKKAEKLGSPSSASSTSKIENAGPAEPVKLGGGDSSIAHIPTPLKKQITSDFKAMPSGKYLADPAEDIFGNLVNLAAAHGKTVSDGLSVDQVLKTIDETHSKNLGVGNSGMLHKKITDWLGTAAGKQYAEAHSTPDSKVVKQLSGEIDLPKGVTLEPGQKVQKLAGPGPHDESLPASAFHAANASQAQEAQDAYMKANGIKWSAEQKSAIKSYTGSSYHTYNSYLRGEGSASQSTKQTVVTIQSAMMPLPQHTLLKRGTGWPPELKSFQSDPHKLLGKTFEDPAFVSTTVAGSSGHFSGQPLQLIIEAPKGTPAAFVNGVSHFKNQENEMLLAAGTKFKVLSVEKTTGGHTVLRVRIVGDK